MTNIETMKLALDALEACEEDYIYDGEEEYECDKIDWEKRNKAIAALRQAISEAKQAVVKESLTTQQAEKLSNSDNSVNFNINQEPVAYRYDQTHVFLQNLKPTFRTAEDRVVDGPKSWVEVPLYTAPQQREWVSLTDDEIYEVNKDLGKLGGSDAFRHARAIEAKLKEQNS